MTRRWAEGLALWCLTSALTLNVLFLGPLFDGTSIWHRLGAALVAIPSVTFFYEWVRVSAHRLRLRRITGVWYYFTHPHNNSADPSSHGFGRMEVFTNRFGDLDYRVSLFRSHETLLQSAVSTDARAASHGDLPPEVVPDSMAVIG